MITLASATRTSSARPDRFFAKWIDHASWPAWSPDTEWTRVEGPVRVGARGVLKPAGGPKTGFTISECERDRAYTDVSSVPGARLTFRHTVEPTETGSELAVEVRLDGPLSWFWARTAFKGFATSVPEDLDRLIGIVEAA
ncbi:SRPBCC family protein [Cnuibacter sp. UC19_7]|uniref:SRPBCC family protein n=1 Tax=Cnuibacter sp. UC19_7 TaxID=3350166 RepID=UPI00367122DD